MTPTTPALTIVVPVYNSEGSLPLLVERLEKVLPQIAGAYELILERWQPRPKLAGD